MINKYNAVRDKVQREFISKCLYHVAQKYKIGVYEDSKQIEEQLKFIQDFLIEALQGFCKSHLTLQYYCELISFYDVISKPSVCLLSEQERKILKRSIILVLGEASNNELIDDEQFIITDEQFFADIFLLLEIQKKIVDFSDGLFRFYLLGNKCHYFEITKDDFVLTMHRGIGEKYNHFIDENTDQINDDDEKAQNQKNCDNLKAALLDCFGEEEFRDLFDVLYDYTIHPEISEYVIDIASRNENFVNALILHKFDLKQAIIKPHLENRLQYRPILKYNVNGVTRYFTSCQLVDDAIKILASNRIPFGSVSLPEEWREIVKMKRYADNKSEVRGIEFERSLKDIVSDKYCIFTNIKKVNGIKIHNATKGSSEENVGQIDAIIIDTTNKRIYIADCKRRRFRYDMASYNAEYNTYNEDSKKLKRKTEWICNHLADIRIEYRLAEDISDYKVLPLFVVHYFTALSFNYNPPIVMMKKLNNWLDQN